MAIFIEQSHIDSIIRFVNDVAETPFNRLPDALRRLKVSEAIKQLLFLKRHYEASEVAVDSKAYIKQQIQLHAQKIEKLLSL